MNRARLGVNIDHIATLRQARGEYYPRPTRGAEVAIKAGAQQITLHLREDRRHIQDRDVFAVKEITEQYGVDLNLELGCEAEIVEIASTLNPQWFCLVPERRQERTTEGGLDVNSPTVIASLKKTIDLLRSGSPHAQISFFIQADENHIKMAADLGADAIEIHTGEYAREYLENKKIDHHLSNYQHCYDVADELGLSYHAGHGLTLESLKPLLEMGLFREYNIGHWIIAESLFCGLEQVIANLKKLMNKYPLEAKKTRGG